ncbi:MAG: hypothetical protein IJ056_08140 [Acidaminococcaceae bacterium]|nr:hypothetical protein [Acidaminococcaceae bacterium]MBQ9697869.1 hypothetical protein [Acidaminococcaceae bacterium]MBR1590418.1 hypothetical protein [Acidaminococcaceae bacterium]
MQITFKKILATAGIMSCLFASSVFAATVTTTPEEDAFTQATAQKQNEAYDKSHGYANEGVRKTQQERSEEGWKEIHPDGKQPTQRERAEAGWKNQKKETVHKTQQERSEEGWKEIHPDGKQPTQRERAEAGWKNQKENEAVERDKQTQAEAVKANREYDKAHGYDNK